MGAVEFKKELGLGTAVTVIVGSMIGSGILILPGSMAGLLGNSGLLMLAWVVPGFLAIAGALTFAEMASSFPKAGGQYVFLREGLGHGWSYLYGWAMFWVIMTGIIAAVAVAFATFVDFFFPLPGPAGGAPLGPFTLPKWGVAFVAVACIVALSAINYAGVRFGGLVQNLSTAAKVLGLAGLVVGVLLFGSPDHSVLGSVALDAPTGLAAVGAFGAALTLAMFAYDGWPQATFVAAEVKEPKRNLPKALLLGPLITMGVYLAVVFAYIYALPVDQAAASPRVAADAALAVFGGTGGQVIALVAIISTFGTVNAYVLTSPRVFYAMSKDGALLKGMGKLHAKHATPAFATILTAEWASLLVLTGTYAQLVTITVFSLWLFYIPTVLAYFKLHRDPRIEKPFRTPFYPWVPLLFLGAALFIVTITLVTSPVQALFSLLLIGAGVPVFLWQARKAGRIVGKDGRETVLAPVEEPEA